MGRRSITAYIIVAEELLYICIRSFAIELSFGGVVAGEGADVAGGAVRADEPSVGAFLENINEVSARQLQLVVVLRREIVNCLESLGVLWNPLWTCAIVAQIVCDRGG